MPVPPPPRSLKRFASALVDTLSGERRARRAVRSRDTGFAEVCQLEERVVLTISPIALTLMLVPQESDLAPEPLPPGGTPLNNPTITDPKVEPIPTTLPEDNPGVVPAGGAGETAA